MYSAVDNIFALHAENLAHAERFKGISSLSADQMGDNQESLDRSIVGCAVKREFYRRFPPKFNGPEGQSWGYLNFKDPTGEDLGEYLDRDIQSRYDEVEKWLKNEIDLDSYLRLQTLPDDIRRMELGEIPYTNIYNMDVRSMDPSQF